jgi:hypothetical protein
MNSLTIENVNAAEAIALKYELAQSGLVLVQDYIWEYHPVKYNHDWSTNPLERSRVVFTFSDPALASFYRLKWTK